MFEKLFLLVKNNAGTAVINNPVVPEKYRDAVINEASSSIIEVLKSYMEGGRLKEMIKYFQFTGVYNNPLITSAVKKFANKLNNFYNIDSTEALAISKTLIPPVIQELIKESKSEINKEFALTSLLSKLSGNRSDMHALVNQIALG